MKPSHLLTLLVFTLIFSCKNDDDNSLSDTNPNPNPEVFTENFGNDINRDFLGEVVDQNNNPIHNATVTIGNQTTLTDANGIFIIRDANIYERFGYVRVEKAGYIHGSRSVVPTNGTNKVKIMLLEETVVGSTSSGTVETISLSNGASVALEGEYIKEDGSAYSGSVNVIMHHIDPTDENMPKQMPGMLYGSNTQNQERGLQTFGMLAVELRGNNGEDLNLAIGSTAEITVPLDASLLATAPATIPLWYFDEVTGYWKEEGLATLVGNNYVGTVSHFSFWNCPIGFEPIILHVITSDDQGNIIPYVSISIQSENYGSAWGFSYIYGIDCGFVPKNELLEIEIYNRSTCGSSAVYNANIGPFSIDSFYNTSIPSNIEIIPETIFGNFNTCDGDPIIDGYVVLIDENSTSGSYYDFVDDGLFELSTIRCNSAPNVFKIKAFDYVNIQETDTLNFTYTSPLTNLGAIVACNTVDEFITYQIDEEESVTYVFGVQSWLDGVNYLYAGHYMLGSDNEFSLSIGSNNSPITVGTFNNPNELSFSFRDENYMSDPNGIGTNIELNLSFLGNAGEYIDMNFTGTFIDANSNVEHSISGTIHAMRDF